MIYRFNPCQPCCTSPCGWGPLHFNSTTEIADFQQFAFSGAPTWEVSGGKLLMTGGDGSFFKTTSVPDPTGKLPDGHPWVSGSLTMPTTIASSGGGTKEGVFIGVNSGGVVFYADWNARQYSVGKCDGNGVATRASPLPVVPKTGDVISICMVAQASNKFSVVYSVNSKVIATEIDTIPDLTTGPTVNSGFWAVGGAVFDDASLVCGATCGTSTGCQNCQGDLAQCWSLECEGVIFNPSKTPQVGPPNGHHCLQAAGCTLIENQAPGWRVDIGSNPWVAVTGPQAPGASMMTWSTNVYYILTTPFNCSGSNTFNLLEVASGSFDWPASITITPMDCNSPPCVTATCGGCSWPTAWTVEIDGFANAPVDHSLDNPNAGAPEEGNACQPSTPFLGNIAFGSTQLLTPPPGWPDSPCYHLNGHDGPLVPDCTSLNGLYTLTVGAPGWIYVGPLPTVCLDIGGVVPGWPLATLSCYAAATPGVKSGKYIFDVPGPGFLFLLATPEGGNGWAIPSVGQPPRWACAEAVSSIPYFCPLAEIACLQPITLNQLPFQVWPAFIQMSMCEGWPASVTLTPA
ncbi:MAG TPA: hypothetical protein VFG04_04265 [Planctomycetaceae bacterium]|nr:hypothetical protein [Planctomycetaceae bacterium]